MFEFKKGDIFISNAQALVNTVNFEGFMGKGIAYQFKQLYPASNIDYVRAIDNNELYLGKIHYFIEKERIIINFPTKIKWRENSKLEYIEIGLDQLVILIRELKIQSIAIPPLGCGNGGLFWPDVKNLIISKLESLSKSVDITIFEPSQDMDPKYKKEPVLDSNALILMEIKGKLNRFNKSRLMIATYFVNCYSKYKYFEFSIANDLPYDRNVELISDKIKAFQKFYNVYSLAESQLLLRNKLISKSVESKFTNMETAITKGCALVNSIENDSKLKELTSLFFIIEQTQPIAFEELALKFSNSYNFFPENNNQTSILSNLEILEQKSLIRSSMLGIMIDL